MSSPDHSCSRCGKICKDKRGLTLHLKSCEGIKVLTCSYCNCTFVNQYTLSVHLFRCNQSKKHIKDQEQLLHEENHSLKERLSQIESRHQTELSDLKNALRIDLERQLKIRDNDVSSLINEYKDLEKNFEVLKGKYEMLEEEKKSLIVEKQTLTELNARLSLKDTTTIINQNDNRIQMNCLEPSMIQGRIHPPDYVIGSVNDLMNMLRSLGVRNSYRVNDRARGTLSWNKPGEGEVRDPKGDQMLTHIIDVLTPDITLEKCYYEEELKKQYQLDDPDVYLMNTYKTFVDFCSGLLKRDSGLLQDIRRELVKQGKAKNDTEVDPIREVTYNKFITSIAVSLFPVMNVWVDKTFYELGRFLATKINNYYHIEGASRQMHYIIVHSDSNHNHYVNAEKLTSLMTEAFETIILTDVIEQTIENLLTTYKGVYSDRVVKMINYLKTPTLDDTKEIMRGIVSL
jgi:hypothetical protein